MNSMRRLLRQRQRQSKEEPEIMNTMMNEASLMMEFLDTLKELQGSGSRPGRIPNHPRERLSRGENLMEDYFIPRLIFIGEEFHQRYRMRNHVFDRIMTTLCNQDDYWHQKPYAIGLHGFIPQQKITVALRMLASGAAADQFAEICRMGESTSLEFMKKFCQQVEELFGEEYLRAPTHVDLQRLIARTETRGFPGAQNGINVLGQSLMFDKVIVGNGPTVMFHVNGSRYNNVYYLADDIYPKYSAIVKIILNPVSQAQKLFAKKQEAYRKDVKRCFGILQSRWAILRHGARMHKRSTLRSIMMACIILYNMIVEEEFVEEEFVEPADEDLMNPTT